MIKSLDNHQYLSFLIEEEEYCVNILTVQEIRGWEKTKPIPNSPSYVKGVVNLRGNVIPIVDLRLRFGVQQQEYTATTVVIYLRVQTSSKQQVIGVVVDAVSEVYTIEPNELKPCPEFIGAVDVQYLDAIAVVNESMVAVINMDKVFDIRELQQLAVA
ncbi:chemotaxis protein CheW [Pleionea sediminis]|uniref:chemotaxis protein CheW n=1 Tax=Pleionea sediminis TaxID=2569479 RepID=UPI00197BE07D|nr:chemotaxis protein CheW [Pleionea sediminis]